MRSPEFINLPMKGWQLVDIYDGQTSCDYCHTRIRWEYHLKHPEVKQQLVVGNECVKSFIDEGDAEAALKFLKAEWIQRRGYFYKRAHGRVFVIGQNKWKKWWVAYTPSVAAITDYWTFSGHKFHNVEEAKDYVARIVCSGRAKVLERCPFPTSYVAARTDYWEDDL